MKDWQTASQDQPIPGAQGLGCDGRSVREWIRVTCRYANGNGSRAKAVTVDKGAGPDVFTFAKDGVASIVARYLPGTEIEATFEWEDESRFALKVTSWPKDATQQRPLPVARFTGAPDKNVRTEERLGACYCYQTFGGMDPPAGDICEGVPADAFAPECLRAWKPKQGSRESCFGLQECQWASPSGYAECLPDEVHFGACPTCRCAKSCSASKPCTNKDHVCIESPRGGMVCL